MKEDNKYNIGDMVMFDPEGGRYAKYFGGSMATIESISYASDGKLHFRVRWLKPVPYFGKMATISDFSADKFIKC
jgi:hypothetical protein